jgi:hypothetical protein
LLWWRWLWWRWLWPVVVLSAEVLQAAVLQAAELLPAHELLPLERQFLLCTASHVLRSGADLLRSGADLLCSVPVVRRSGDRYDRSAAAEQCSGPGTQCLMCELIPGPDREPDSRGNPPVRVRFLFFFAGYSRRRHSPSRTR